MELGWKGLLNQVATGIKSNSGQKVMKKPKESKNDLPESQPTVASVGPG